MKKIVILLVFVVSLQHAQAQIFAPAKVQEKANGMLAYVTGYLVSDTLTYKTLMLRDTTQTIVMLSDIFANDVYALMKRADVDSVNSWMRTMSSDPGRKGKIWLIEFTLTYVEDFSYQSKRKIRRIEDPYQRSMTKTFNKNVKYLVMRQNPDPVPGKRITDRNSPNFGKIIPDFATVGSKDVVTDTDSKSKEVTKEVAQKKGSMFSPTAKSNETIQPSSDETQSSPTSVSSKKQQVQQDEPSPMMKEILKGKKKGT